MTDTRPILRLKPKADARRIRFGHPWAWADDLVLDRRSRAISAGAVAVLEDAERRPLGVGIATVEAKIGFRVLDRDPEAEIDTDWLSAKLSAAARSRETLYDAPYYRLVHAEGDGLPGLIVDRFGETLVLQPNAIWLEDRLPDLVGLLQELTGCTRIIKNGTSRARAQEGLAEEMTLLAGAAPDGPIPVPMNGATYLADVMGGQKTGLFYDQRPNHAFAARLSKDARVLDVFSHVGGFALAALAAGAHEAVAVDSSEAALELAARGAAAMGVSLSTRAGDAFAMMEALAGEGAVFDLVIADPPAFAPSKTALEKGLRAYERVARMAAPLVAEGGTLILCSCSHAADLGKFRAACLRGIGRAGRSPRLISHRLCRAGPPGPPGVERNRLPQGFGVQIVKAVLDACVVYPTFLRQVLLGVAERGGFAPVWSERLIEEWRRAAERNGGPTDAAFAEIAAAEANRRFPDAMTPPGDAAPLWLPDPADVHVLATAIAGGAETIITLNLKDFPKRELSGHGIAARSPDDVLMAAWLDAPEMVEPAVAAAHRAAEAHGGESLPLRPLLKRARLPRLGKALSR